MLARFARSPARQGVAVNKVETAHQQSRPTLEIPATRRNGRCHRLGQVLELGRVRRVVVSVDGNIHLDQLGGRVRRQAALDLGVADQRDAVTRNSVEATLQVNAVFKAVSADGDL
mgnify:CR=1 FL=1